MTTNGNTSSESFERRIREARGDLMETLAIIAEGADRAQAYVLNEILQAVVVWNFTNQLSGESWDISDLRDALLVRAKELGEETE